MNRLALENQITPERLAQFDQLKLLTDILVDGFMAGLHPSLFPGSGYEFSQLKAYQPGDPINRIDWKLFGRSDRYYIREAEKESKLSLSIWLDSSASMAQVGHKTKVSKFRYGVWLTACLTKIGLLQGDEVGFSAVNDLSQRCSPASGENQLMRVLNILNRLQPKNTLDSSYIETFKKLHRSDDLVVIITDGYQNDEELLELITFGMQSNRKIIVFGLLVDTDLVIKTNSEVELVDLETGRTKILSRTQTREFQRLSAQRLESLSGWCSARGIEFHWSSIDQPLDKLLHVFLTKRLGH